jgi:hypothetical protein
MRMVTRVLTLSAMTFAALVAWSPQVEGSDTCCTYGSDCPGYELCCEYGLYGTAPCDLQKDNFCRNSCTS